MNKRILLLSLCGFFLVAVFMPVKGTGGEAKDAMGFVYIKTKKIPGVCQGTFQSQFLVSKHDSRTIKATIQIRATYGGQHSTTQKVVKVYPREDVELGCTGEQLSGAHTTYWKRKILAAWFE